MNAIEREQRPNFLERWGPPLPHAFFEQDAIDVATGLLGAMLLRHDANGSYRWGRITETEAYLGEHDMASHARFGRTKRTEVMYGAPGRSYVYLIYGMYHMLNVVAAPVGQPQAVLIRAIEPLGGVERTVDGPGKLTRALEIDMSFNGLPLSAAPLSIHPGRTCPEPIVTPRVGIDYAGEWRDAPLRFLAPQ